MSGISKAAAEFGRLGGSARSKRKSEAARLNGKLGGRPSTRNSPRETFDLQHAIARHQRIRLLKSSIETVLTSDKDALDRAEISLLKDAVRQLAKIEKRISKAVQVHELDRVKQI